MPSARRRAPLLQMQLSRTSGVRATQGDTEVIARARAALASGPLDDVELLGRVLALPAAPPRVAARIAEALFARHEGFVRSAAGAWELQLPLEAGVEPGARVPLLRQLRYAVVDVETTGGAARSGHRITEIAVVPVDAGVVGDPWVRLVNPERPIMPQVVALTRITQAMVARAPRFSEVATDVVGRLQSRVFVAHNATFDWGFVTAELGRVDDLTLAGDRLCTVKLARVLLPQLRRRSLDALAHYYGVEIEGRHRAGGDALATARILCRLLEEAEEQGFNTWPDLSARLDRRTARARRKRRALPRPVDYDTSA